MPDRKSPDQKPPAGADGSVEYDPWQRRQQTMDSLRDAEQQTSGERTNTDGSVDDQQRAESHPDNNHTVDYDSFSEQKSTKNRFNFKKTSSITGGAIALLIGLAGIMSFFGGPGLLIVNISEVLTEKLNFQLSPYNNRTVKIMSGKLKNSTTGVCGKKLTVRCKYATFSEREIKNFRNAGIVIETDGDVKKRFNRYKVTSMTFEGKRITPDTFQRTLGNDVAFRRAVFVGFNPKFASMSDKVFYRFSGKMGFSKASPFSDEKSDKERFEKLKKQTKDGRTDTSVVTQDAKCTEDPESAACQQEKDENEKRKKTMGEIEEISKKYDGKPAATKILKGVGAGATRAIKVTGVADTGCAFLRMYRSVSIGSKLIRNTQMIRLAASIHTVGSMIKAGDANPDDVAFVGNLLTKTVSQGDGTISKSATDSALYRSVAYGDKGLDLNATPYVSGGSFGGKMASVPAAALAMLGGRQKADKTCGFLSNIFVQAGSLVIGGILGFFTGGGFTVANVAGQAGFGGALMLAETILPAMIADFITGDLIDEETTSEDYGNILSSGTAGMLSGVAISGGSGIATQGIAEQTIAEHNETTLAYAELERSSLSPLDISSRHTALGSIVYQAAPTMHQIASSPVVALTKLASLPSLSLGALETKSSAATLYSGDTNGCKDLDYQYLGVATTESCSIIPGLPNNLTDKDPNVINEQLLAKDLIDPETGEPKGDYADFVEKCIDRTTPFGVTPEDERMGDGSECIIGDSNNPSSTTIPDEDKIKIDYYTHYIDQRVNESLENGLPEPISASQTDPSDVSSTTVVDGTDKELAQKILDNKKISINDSRYRSQIQNYANGNSSCFLDSRLLKLIASLGEEFSFTITSINRACTRVSVGAGTSSLHWKGRAVDFGIVNGVKSTGGTKNDIDLINAAMRILPDESLGIGQVNSRGGPGKIDIPSGNKSIEFDDSPNHVHIGIQ